MGSPFLWQTRIRFVDTDASGRIHYTSLFRHFEVAEQEFLRAAGCPFTDPRLAEFTFPRVHVECDYQAGLRYDDSICIAMTLERMGTSSYTLAFHVTGEDGRTAASGRIVVVCIARREQKATPIPACIAGVLRTIEGD